MVDAFVKKVNVLFLVQVESVFVDFRGQRVETGFNCNLVKDCLQISVAELAVFRKLAALQERRHVVAVLPFVAGAVDEEAVVVEPFGVRVAAADHMRVPGLHPTVLLGPGLLQFRREGDLQDGPGRFGKGFLVDHPELSPLVDGVLQHLAQDEPGLGPGVGAGLGGDVGLPDLIALLALQPDHLMVHLPDSRGEEFAAEVIVHAAGLEAAAQPVQVGQRELEPAALVANLVGVGLGRHSQCDDLADIEACGRGDSEKAHEVMFG